MGEEPGRRRLLNAQRCAIIKQRTVWLKVPLLRQASTNLLSNLPSRPARLFRFYKWPRKDYQVLVRLGNRTVTSAPVIRIFLEDRLRGHSLSTNPETYPPTKAEGKEAVSSGSAVFAMAFVVLLVSLPLFPRAGVAAYARSR